MVLDSRLVEYVDDASVYFGGIEVIQHLMTQSEIEYVVMFPGFVVCMKSWDLELDLRDYGYIVNTPYRVFNQDWEFIYENRSSSGQFGESDNDLFSLVESPNASYLHITFETLSEPVCGLLWVCNQLSPAQVELKIDQWKMEKDAGRTEQTISEIFIDTSGLANSGYLNIYYIGRPWEAQLSLFDIENDPLTDIVRQDLSQTLVLYPQASGWYIIAHVIDDTPYIVVFNDLYGTGVRRIRFTDEGSFFIDFSNSSLNPPLLYPTSLPAQDSNDAWLNTNHKIRLNSTAIYFGASGTSRGSSDASAVVDTSSLMTSGGLSIASMTYVDPPSMLSRSVSTGFAIASDDLVGGGNPPVGD